MQERDFEKVLKEALEGEKELALQEIRMIADDGKGTYERVRVGARGILFRGEKLLLSHERVTDFWCLPGGGLEAGELLRETCRREIAEEDGVDALVGREFAVVDSCYKEWTFSNHFFFCEYGGDTNRNRTEQEIRDDLQPEWVTLDEALMLFGDVSRHEDDAMYVGCYRRDFQVLSLLKEWLMSKSQP